MSRIFAGGPIGPCGAVWAESRPVKAINKTGQGSPLRQTFVILSEAKDLCIPALQANT